MESILYFPALYIGRKDTRLRVYSSVINYQRVKMKEENLKCSLAFVFTRVHVMVVSKLSINVKVVNQMSCLF